MQVTPEMVTRWNALGSDLFARAEELRREYALKLAVLEHPDRDAGPLWRETQDALDALRAGYELEAREELHRVGDPGGSAAQTCKQHLLMGEGARVRLHAAFTVNPTHHAIASGHALRRVGDMVGPAFGAPPPMSRPSCLSRLNILPSPLADDE